MYPVDKDIPVPPANRGKGRPAKYPFLTMEVGDSFLIPAGDKGFYHDERGSRAHNAVTAARRYNRMGMRFQTRTQPDGSVRIWRVA